MKEPFLRLLSGIQNRLIFTLISGVGSFRFGAWVLAQGLRVRGEEEGGPNKGPRDEESSEFCSVLLVLE